MLNEHRSVSSKTKIKFENLLSSQHMAKNELFKTSSLLNASFFVLVLLLDSASCSPTAMKIRQHQNYSLPAFDLLCRNRFRNKLEPEEFHLAARPTYVLLRRSILHPRHVTPKSHLRLAGRSAQS